MFNPAINSKMEESIQALITKSIQLCSEDFRNELYSHIVISGGNTLFEGFAERLQQEVQALAPIQIREIKVIAQTDRRYGAWRGGAAFA